MDCSICFEAITAETGKTVMGCGHEFHFRCMASWFVTQCDKELPENCPCCRHEAGPLECLPEIEDHESLYSDDDEDDEWSWLEAEDALELISDTAAAPNEELTPPIQIGVAAAREVSSLEWAHLFSMYNANRPLTPFTITWQRASETRWERTVVLNPETDVWESNPPQLTTPPDSLVNATEKAATKFQAIWRGSKQRSAFLAARTFARISSA